VRRKLFGRSTFEEGKGRGPGQQVNSYTYSIRATNPGRKEKKIVFFDVCAGEHIGSSSVRSQAYVIIVK